MVFKKDNLVNIVLDLQSEKSQFIDSFGACFDKVTSNLDKLSKKLEKAESSLLQK